MKLSLLSFIFTLLPICLAVLAGDDLWQGSLPEQFDYNLIDTFEDQLDKRAVNNKASDTGASDLSEYAPIQNSIVQSGIQYYSFNVNASTGLGEQFEYLVFVTGNICSQPSNLANSNNDSLVVYYSFNSSILTSLENSQMGSFSNGYFQALADVSISEVSSVLYIAVQAPQSTNVTDSWFYQIGVSQNDLVYQWDLRSFVDIVDTDDHSALIVTGNLTLFAGNVSEFNSSQSMYQLLVYENDMRNYFSTLNESWCAVRSGPSLPLSATSVSSYTTRGGTLRQQFYVDGLNASTQYVGYLVADVKDKSGAAHGGTIYGQFEFETMSSDACSLIYDLDFCDEVAYSVPASSLEEYQSPEALKALYDDQASSLFVNFSKALQQIPCNTTKDAIFSPTGSCEKCHTSYKNWLCSVTIPRCSTRNITGYKHREANTSRNAFIEETVVPMTDYFEVLPCVNVCHIMARDCPADFGFNCPQSNSTIQLSYYWDDAGDYASCNFVGTVLTVASSAGVLRIAWRVILGCVVFLIMTV